MENTPYQPLMIMGKNKNNNLDHSTNKHIG